MSILARTGDSALRSGLRCLADDLRTGAWRDAHADLLAADTLDVGYCTVAVELS